MDYNKVTYEAEKILATEHVARVIRDYIDNFFGCETCRQHFVVTYDNCGHDRCDRLKDEPSNEEMDWIQLPMWLYETHNAVNVRLLRERSARENREVSSADVAAVRWPPRRECSACWLSSGEWDEDMVYKYLRLEYGQRDASSAELRREIMSLQENNEGTEGGRSLVMPGIGYLLVLLAVVSAYRWRRRQIKSESIDSHESDVAVKSRKRAGSGDLAPPDLLAEQQTRKAVRRSTRNKQKTS